MATIVTENIITFISSLSAPVKSIQMEQIVHFAFFFVVVWSNDENCGGFGPSTETHARGCPQG